MSNNNYITRECDYASIDKVLKDYSAFGYELTHVVQCKCEDKYKLIFKKVN